MPVILLALVALAAVAIVIFWFMRANPSTLARVLRPILVVLGGIGIAGLLIFGIRFLPGLLPELFGLAGVVITELLALHLDCSADADSLRILEPYLDRRLGPDWRNARQPPHGSAPRGPRSDMTGQEALAVLGLAEGASADDIKAAHRRPIQRMHPDVGGSADLAARITRAKDVLLGG